VSVRNSAARRANVDAKHKLLLSAPETSAKDFHVVDKVLEGNLDGDNRELALAPRSQGIYRGTI
jgi:hypothetical protein